MGLGPYLGVVLDLELGVCEALLCLVLGFGMVGGILYRRELRAIGY